MGRTGRKREGRVIFLLTEGKEARDHIRSQDAYEKIQQKIAAGNEFHFDLDKSPRILPREYQPDCIKKHITPPNETPEALELKVDKRKKVAKPQRQWNMPENVETGFVRASSLGKRKRPVEPNSPKGFVDPSTLGSPFLTREEEDLARQLRVHVSPTPKSMGTLDTKSTGSIPSGSIRNRLVQTRKKMRDTSRPNREISAIDIEILSTTPPRLLASGITKGLSQCDPNVPRQNGTVTSRIQPPSSSNPFKNWDVISSSDDDLPDLSTALFNGKQKPAEPLPKIISVNSDEEYGLPSEFDTPRKRIRIEQFSDED
jgi:hypothetical protein